MWNGNRNQLFKACQRLYKASIEEDLDELNDEDFFIASLSMDVVANCITLLTASQWVASPSLAVNVRTIWEALALLKLNDEKRITARQLRLFKAQAILFYDDFFLKINGWNKQSDKGIEEEHDSLITLISKELGVSEEEAEKSRRHEFLFFTEDPKKTYFKAFDLMNIVFPERREDYKRLSILVHPFYEDGEESKKRAEWLKGLIDVTIKDVGDFLDSHGFYVFGPKNPSLDSITKKADRNMGPFTKTLTFASQAAMEVICKGQKNRAMAKFDTHEGAGALLLLQQMYFSLYFGFYHEPLLLFKSFIELIAVWDCVENEVQVDGFRAYTSSRFADKQKDWDANYKALSDVFKEYYEENYGENFMDFVKKMRTEHLHFIHKDKKDYQALAGDYLYGFIGRISKRIPMSSDEMKSVNQYLFMEYQRSVKYSHGRGYLFAFKDCWTNIDLKLEFHATDMFIDKLLRISRRSGEKNWLVDSTIWIFQRAAKNFTEAYIAFKNNDKKGIEKCEAEDKEINDAVDRVNTQLTLEAVAEIRRGLGSK